MAGPGFEMMHFGKDALSAVEVGQKEFHVAMAFCPLSR